MVTRELYVEKIEAQFKKLASKVEDLRDQADRGSKEAKARLDRISKELKPHERAFRQQLNEARSASNEAWRDLRGGVEAAWRDLKDAYDKAISSHRRTAGTKSIPRRNSARTTGAKRSSAKR
ncbi:MAG: hypothetical protein HY901_02450 [Deltaproteobacteria bacterium]|nr:hypothetical protein [Deltaproteobacteria bacterium]